MVEKSMESFRRGGPFPALLGAAEPPVVYGITAVHYEGGCLAEVMMGMIDRSLEHWDLRPAPTRLVEVVDRLVEGDTVVTLFPTERGTLRMGTEVKVDVLPEGIETLAAVAERAGQRLIDLPRY